LARGRERRSKGEASERAGERKRKSESWSRGKAGRTRGGQAKKARPLGRAAQQPTRPSPPPHRRNRSHEERPSNPTAGVAGHLPVKSPSQSLASSAIFQGAHPDERRSMLDTTRLSPLSRPMTRRERPCVQSQHEGRHRAFRLSITPPSTSEVGLDGRRPSASPSQTRARRPALPRTRPSDDASVEGYVAQP